jgi:hypothetical protein
MSKGSSHLQTHIRAAQEWLGRADRSLQRQEEVKGDLQLMLARAEMQRAQEVRPGTKKQYWAYRLLPLITALFLCGGAGFLYEGRMVQHEQVIQPRPVSSSAATTAGGSLQPAADGTEGLTTVHISSAVPAQERAAVPERAAVSEQPAAEPASSRLPEAAARPERPAAAASLPSRHMQDLMRSAGDTLRKQ